MRNEGGGGADGQLADAPRAGDVFGEIEVVHAQLAGGLGHLHRQVIRRGAQHGVAAAHRGTQRRGVGDVELQGGQARRFLRVGLDLGQLRSGSVGNRHAIAGLLRGLHEQVGHHGADLPATDHQDVLHGPPSLSSLE